MIYKIDGEYFTANSRDEAICIYVEKYANVIENDKICVYLYVTHRDMSINTYHR